ncbi:GGDEF domain-containing protein [Pseudomonas sp. EL_65y_Pfl2_R95]|uniref:GGDEF domain-containing protein n=1 Tax=Pseudomonas sp. EL_65y_Pfl2_R95 TaxID=3088698 RepID=UPI0030DA4D36
MSLLRPQPPLNKELLASGIEDASKRRMLRVIIIATGITLSGFALLQFLAGNHLFALFEVCASVLLVIGGWHIIYVRHLMPWVYVYVLPTSSFLVYIIVMPNASASAFVWIYMIPLLSYLLLGRVHGFFVSVPFMLVSTLLYFQQHRYTLDAGGMIDLGNAMLCGLLIIVFVHIYESLRAQAYRQLERLAQTDALTGVESRGCFQQALERSIQEAERSKLSFVLVILDVDHFKQVNDQWGHVAGDLALKHLCTSILQRLRVTDSMGRLGGEEFGLLLRNTDLNGAKPLVEDLRQQLASSPLAYGNQEIPLSATFGVAEWPSDGHSLDRLYRCADRRLYYGKQQGRNQLVTADSISEVDFRTDFAGGSGT